MSCPSRCWKASSGPVKYLLLPLNHCSDFMNLIMMVAGHVMSPLRVLPIALKGHSGHFASLCWAVFNMFLCTGTVLWSLSRTPSLYHGNTSQRHMPGSSSKKCHTQVHFVLSLFATGQEKLIGDSLACHW